MRMDPERSPRINNIWNSGDFTGADRKACARVTIQKATIKTHPTLDRIYRSVLMGQASEAVELPNVKSIEIQRTIDQDAATCTVTFYNTKPLAVGELPPNEWDIEQVGYYTFNRGTATNRWNYGANEWRDFIVPDRLLRTYQGYGSDFTNTVHTDPHLLQTGVWLIDEVNISTDGLITVNCRDLAALLIDQHVYVPVVPPKHYPLIFQPYADLTNHPNTRTPTRSEVPGNYRDYTDIVKQLCAIGGFYWPNIFTSTVSGEPLPPSQGDTALVAAAVITHTESLSGDVLFAFDSATLTDAGRTAIAGIVAKTIGPNPAMTVVGHASSEGTHEYNQQLSEQRAGSVKAYILNLKPGASVRASGKGETAPVASNDTEAGRVANRRVDISYTTQSTTPAAPTGRTYGDFEVSGTYAIAGLPINVFDKKPLMDGVNYVREILGFIFFVEERGGVVFRSPNLFTAGNYVLSDQDTGGRGRTSETLLIDERVHLKSYNIGVTNANKRSNITVGTIDGRIRAEILGFEPLESQPLGVIRQAIWTDQNFADENECTVMADMIKLRQKQMYRKGNPVIPANPNLQPDDQVIIIERQTFEQHRHYITGITSTFDVETGQYDMTLTTHWMGLAEAGSYVDVNAMSAASLDMLREQNKVGRDYYVLSFGQELRDPNRTYVPINGPVVFYA